MPFRFWHREWKKDGWIRHLFGLIFNPSPAAYSPDTSTSVLLDSRVNPPQSQEKDSAPMTIDGFGRMFLESLETVEHRLCSLKTSLASSLSMGGVHSKKLSTILPASGGIVGGVFFPLEMSVRLIYGNDSSYWPTPASSDYKRGSAKILDNGKSRPLSEEATRFHQDQTVTGKISSPSLNPAFVEWLMGIPHSWTGFEPVEMASFQLWWHMHSLLLQRLVD